MAEFDDDVKLEINDRIQVTIKGTDEEIPTTYYSRVEDIEGRDYVIGWPTSRGIRAAVHADSVLLLSFSTETSVYCVESAIVERIREQVPRLRVRPLSPPRSIQRREFVRVPALLDIELSPQGVPAADAAAILRAHTFNLSGGGFAVHASEPLQVESLFEVRLKLPGAKEALVLAAKVVRCELGKDPVKGIYYDIGFAFVEILESVRRKIITHVFRLQQSSLMRP